MRTFLDTNIFLYAAGAEHPLKNLCAEILNRVAESELDATSNSEVVQEILYVLARRGRREEGITLGRFVAALFPDLMPITREDMLDACNLIHRHPKLSVRDAIHAANMLRNGVKHIISADADFDQIPGIHRISPGTHAN